MHTLGGLMTLKIEEILVLGQAGRDSGETFKWCENRLYLGVLTRNGFFYSFLQKSMHVTVFSQLKRGPRRF
jgi:hypothetical protein